jgi:DNA-directed RNA polymerase specialized sigma24 family protein
MGRVRVWDFRAGHYREIVGKPMTYEQAGRFLDLTDKAVGTALMRARRNLAKMLSDEDEESPE